MRKLFQYLCFAPTVYAACIYPTVKAVNEYIYNGEEKLEKSQVETVLREEMKRFNLDVQVETKWSRAMELGSSPISVRKFAEGYVIGIHPQFQPTRSVLKHEVCHIYHGDAEGTTNTKHSKSEWLKYLLFQEPRATLCSLLP